MSLNDLFKPSDAVEVKRPNVIEGPLVDVLASMHVQNAIMNDGSMVTSSFGAHSVKS